MNKDKLRVFLSENLHQHTLIEEIIHLLEGWGTLHLTNNRLLTRGKKGWYHIYENN